VWIDPDVQPLLSAVVHPSGLRHTDLSRDPRQLHSFPTRRSSDLWAKGPGRSRLNSPRWTPPVVRPPVWTSTSRPPNRCSACSPRSEEHTSELQSREKLVCRLPLEKKKRVVRVSRRTLSRRFNASM